MRIARVLTRLNLGGPARQVLASDPRLGKRGHTVRVFVGKPEHGEGELVQLAEAKGIDLVRVPGLGRGLGLGDLRASRFLKKELRAFRPDLVHTHASKAGALGRKAAFKLSGVRTVHTFHGHVLEGYFPEKISQAVRKLETGLAAKTDRIVSVSHATADDLVRLGIAPEEKITVIPPGIEMDGLLAVNARSNHLRRILGTPEGAVLVGVVGRLAEVKQPLWAVEVFEMLSERYQDLHLVFIGDGAEWGALEKRITGGRENVRERVHMVGAQANMVAVMADLDVVLQTSRSEGLPVALIEAAAAGKPVVAANVGGVGEVVAHERTGFLGEDVDELAYGLAQLLDSEAVRVDSGHRARLRVQKRHSAEELTNRLEALYATTLEESQ